MELLITKLMREDNVLLRVKCKLVQPNYFTAGGCTYSGQDPDNGDFKFLLHVIKGETLPGGNAESDLNFEVGVAPSILSDDFFYRFIVVDQQSNAVDTLRIGGGSILAQAEPDEVEKPLLEDPLSPFAPSL